MYSTVLVCREIVIIHRNTRTTFLRYGQKKRGKELQDHRMTKTNIWGNGRFIRSVSFTGQVSDVRCSSVQTIILWMMTIINRVALLSVTEVRSILSRVLYSRSCRRVLQHQKLFIVVSFGATSSSLLRFFTLDGSNFNDYWFVLFSLKK